MIDLMHSSQFSLGHIHRISEWLRERFGPSQIRSQFVQFRCLIRNKVVQDIRFDHLFDRFILRFGFEIVQSKNLFHDQQHRIFRIPDDRERRRTNRITFSTSRFVIPIGNMTGESKQIIIDGFNGTVLKYIIDTATLIQLADQPVFPFLNVGF